MVIAGAIILAVGMVCSACILYGGITIRHEYTQPEQPDNNFTQEELDKMIKEQDGSTMSELIAAINGALTGDDDDE